jgi:hypothetical protein
MNAQTVTITGSGVGVSGNHNRINIHINIHVHARDGVKPGLSLDSVCALELARALRLVADRADICEGSTA